MSKKINKDITDSEELFKRLETGDDSGLDDFEKEAFEGFSSLNDVKLSEKLHTGLNEKITEVYFKPASKKNNLAFFSMAAGLLLMVGVSIFFYQYLSSEKKDMALNTGATTNEMQVMENAPPPPPKTEEKANKLDEAEQKEPLKTAAVVVDKVAQSQAPKDLRQDDREKGIVNIETKKSSGESIADDNSNATSIMENNPGSGADGKLKKQEEGQGNNRSNTGPSGNLAGGAGGKDMDKKQRFGNDKSGKGDDLAKNKSPETKNMEDITPSEKDMDAESETKPTTDYKSKEETVATKRKEDESTNDLSKVSSRDASKKRSKKAEAPSASANTSPAKASEAPAFYTLNFQILNIIRHRITLSLK